MAKVTENRSYEFSDLKTTVTRALIGVPDADASVKEQILNRLHGPALLNRLSEEQVIAFSRQVVWSARRLKEVSRALHEFESYLCDEVPNGFAVYEWKPFTTCLADDNRWNAADAAVFRLDGYPKVRRGIYIHSDACSADDPSGEPCGDRFSVIRYIGHTVGNFDSPRRNKDVHGKTFRYRWTDVILVPGQASFLSPSLEMFLLRKVRTTNNKQHQDRRGVVTLCDMLRENC
jgi:hypothetical protein